MGGGGGGRLHLGFLPLGFIVRGLGLWVLGLRWCCLLVVCFSSLQVVALALQSVLGSSMLMGGFFTCRTVTRGPGAHATSATTCANIAPASFRHSGNNVCLSVCMYVCMYMYKQRCTYDRLFYRLDVVQRHQFQVSAFPDSRNRQPSTS